MKNMYQAPAPVPDDVAVAAQRDGTWALALSVLSLVFCAPVTAPLAIWKASRAMRGGAGRRATVAIILAALGVTSSPFFWFLVIWQYLAPPPPSPRAPAHAPSADRTAD